MTFESKIEKKLVTGIFKSKREAVVCATLVRWAREETLREVIDLLDEHYLTAETIRYFKEHFGVKDE